MLCLVIEEFDSQMLLPKLARKPFDFQTKKERTQSNERIQHYQIGVSHIVSDVGIPYFVIPGALDCIALKKHKWKINTPLQRKNQKEKGKSNNNNKETKTTNKQPCQPILVLVSFIYFFYGSYYGIS